MAADRLESILQQLRALLKEYKFEEIQEALHRLKPVSPPPKPQPGEKSDGFSKEYLRELSYLDSKIPEPGAEYWERTIKNLEESKKQDLPKRPCPRCKKPLAQFNSLQSKECIDCLIESATEEKAKSQS